MESMPKKSFLEVKFFINNFFIFFVNVFTIKKHFQVFLEGAHTTKTNIVPTADMTPPWRPLVATTILTLVVADMQLLEEVDSFQVLQVEVDFIQAQLVAVVIIQAQQVAMAIFQAPPAVAGITQDRMEASIQDLCKVKVGEVVGLQGWFESQEFPIFEIPIKMFNMLGSDHTVIKPKGVRLEVLHLEI